MPWACRSIAVGFSVVLVTAALARADPSPDPPAPPGSDDATDVRLPEEIAARYRSGEFRNARAIPNPSVRLVSPAVAEASLANRGRYDLARDGSIVDTATGKPPGHVFGVPFPFVDPADPKAGLRIAWNAAYQYYAIGDNRMDVQLTWFSRGGVDRQVEVRAIQKFWDGQPEAHPSPDGLLTQQLSVVQSPADVCGTAALSWRYKDERRDSLWTYVPALRRVRAVSPTNRSDGFLGSDASPDDGPFFDGKPQDFRWRLVGEEEELVLMERGAVVDGAAGLSPLPEGGWRIAQDAAPRFVLEERRRPDDRLLPWAPVPDGYVLVRRPVWVVEARPRDPYYRHGHLVLRFDKEGWFGTYSSKYDWQDRLTESYLVTHAAWVRRGDAWISVAPDYLGLAQNFPLDRATGIRRAPGDDTAADVGLTMPAQRFDLDALTRIGR